MIDKANQYFKNRLDSEAWESADIELRNKALFTAKGQLNMYRGMISHSQYQITVFEQAIWLLRDDPRTKLQQAGVQSYSIGSLSETFTDKTKPAHIAPFVWGLLKGGTGVRIGQIK